MIEQERGDRALLVDVGDSLYPRPELAREADIARAHLILEAMGQLGYQAMAVGERDLAGGVDDLKATAAKNKIALVGANLVDRSGAHPFEASRIVPTPLGAVGVIGLSQFTPSEAIGIAAQEPVVAAKQAVSELRSRGVISIVALLHMTTVQAEDLVAKVPGIDVALEAHDGRPAMAAQPRPPLYSLGQKGRELTRVEIQPGSGPIQDGSAVADAAGEITRMDSNYLALEDSASKLTTAQAKREVQAQLEQIRERRLSALEHLQHPEERLASLHVTTLDGTVADDPQIAREVADSVSRYGKVGSAPLPPTGFKPLANLKNAGMAPAAPRGLALPSTPFRSR